LLFFVLQNICLIRIVIVSLCCRPLAANEQGLGAGGASTAARTGAQTCKFAQTFGRATAPLAPNPSWLQVFVPHYNFSIN